ncbi:hypothetical protein M407DRAFT_18398 [Tulasnella calospora MUT 4182]|uniref:Uncharacterized protein n=1 Tax=Tulasnella calospora MUT 4182 TaxID=1051891 RepID=A0A0C3QJT9_9AGAM|nr:hypothetical protein M407DRAFT_18398 [Tulasnella calospora MUT 4182]
MDYQGFGLGLGTASTFRPFGTQDDDEFGDSAELQVTWQSSQVANIRALLEDKKPASKGKDRGTSSRRVSASSSSSKLKSKVSRKSSLPAPAPPGASLDDPIIIGTQESPPHASATPQKLSGEGSSAYASASSTPTFSTPSSGPSTSANSFASSEWDYFPPCFAGSSSSSRGSKDRMSPNPGPIRRTKDPKRLRSKMAPMHRPSSVAGERMDVEHQEGEGDEKGEETRSTSVDSLQAMLRQFGSVVKERAAKEVEVPSKAKDLPSKSRTAAPSRKRVEGWDTKRLKDRTNGSTARVAEIKSAGRTRPSDDLESMDPPSMRSTTTRSCSPHAAVANSEEASGRALPAAEVRRPTTFKEPLPPSKREDKSTTLLKKDMPPPPVPRRPSPLREEQPVPPAGQERRQAPPTKAASPTLQSSSSQSGPPSSSQGRRFGMTSYAATFSQGKVNEPPRTVTNNTTDTYKGANPFKPKSLGMRSAITTSSTTAPSSQSGGFKRTSSNRLPAFQPPIKKSTSPVPHPPPAPLPAPATKSTTSFMDEDGDISMTNSAADTSYGNSFEIDLGELDAIMSPYEQT